MGVCLCKPCIYKAISERPLKLKRNMSFFMLDSCLTFENRIQDIFLCPKQGIVMCQAAPDVPVHVPNPILWKNKHSPCYDRTIRHPCTKMTPVAYIVFTPD